VQTALTANFRVTDANQARVRTQQRTSAPLLSRTKSNCLARQAALVEAFRLLAQLLTWSDQHEPALFDYFVEQRARPSRDHRQPPLSVCVQPPQR